MATKPHIFIVAAEKSGDELGAALAKALRGQKKRAVKLSAIGGSALAAQGLESPVDISPLSILGFVEAVRAYPIVLDRVRQTTEMIMEADADAVVLIDSWGFMMRVAQALRKQKYSGQIIKYVAPQVWAMREGRSKILAEGVDHLLTIHAFDAPYFTRHGLPTHYVGNPIFDKDYAAGDGAALRRDYKIAKDAPVLALLFGSRLSEIQRLAKPFADAISIIAQALPGVRIITPVADTIAADVYAAVANDPRLADVILLSEARKLDCFAAANAAIACSGTVTTQLACAGVPTVVGYKLNALTAFVAKRLYKPDYISIVNIANNQALMPEFVLEACSGENLASAALGYLQSKPKAKAAKKALLDATKTMRESGADKAGGLSSVRAARAILSILNGDRP